MPQTSTAFTFRSISAKVELTVIIEELARMEALGLVVWATPDPEGLAQEAYIAAHPQWRDDFLLATAGDFLAELGRDMLGWDEMSDEERDACREERVALTVSRRRRHVPR